MNAASTLWRQPLPPTGDEPDRVEVAGRRDADAERAGDEDRRVEGDAPADDVAQQAEEKRAGGQARVDGDEDVAGRSAYATRGGDGPNVTVRNAELELDWGGDEAEQLGPGQVGEETEAAE